MCLQVCLYTCERVLCVYKYDVCSHVSYSRHTFACLQIVCEFLCIVYLDM
jgi:hypothetical protein